MDQSSSSSTTTGQQVTYTVPQIVQEKYPDLVELIKKTESMTKEERDYWFQILPIMTADQIERLKKILADEATQLAKLDEQYQGELSKLNQKHMEEWSMFEKKQQKEELIKKEQAHEAEEAKVQEDLLNKLDQA